MIVNKNSDQSQLPKNRC